MKKEVTYCDGCNCELPNGGVDLSGRFDSGKSQNGRLFPFTINFGVMVHGVEPRVELRPQARPDLCVGCVTHIIAVAYEERAKGAA